ncbi:molybdopterin molybdotransferase MoeA [Saliphagus infecundisoli]|uniref:Gephyrin-like molybdotransferase Glp n=1 Tax=Saliphagus infecundisoli TaxID=1849069 RepID=A0ABD5QHZ2_9EURY|nr:gephyrin-like molybdotransferase Glp [Saliphagus infecundisoli]
MDGLDDDRSESGFRSRTPLSEARERFRAAVPDPDFDPVRLELAAADGRVLATARSAARNVPDYARVAMDGYAVRAEDTFDAGARSPAVLREVEETVEPGTARRVDTGTELPEGADAVVRIEYAEPFGGDVEITDRVTVGENVAPVGEDVARGDPLFEAGRRLGPSALGLLRSVGVERVPVAPRPTVGVVPTGEELVRADPAPGEIIETNGLTVSRFVERWGGRATHRNIVDDDPEALRVAIQRDLTKDVVVTTGGSSVGERDLLPETIEGLGEVVVHGVGIKPGYPVALGVVEGTPVIALPGYPVAAIVAANAVLRPLLAWLQGTTVETHPARTARLERKIPSEPGIRTYARVELAGSEDEDGGSNERVATPIRAGGAGVLSSAALADGWVVVSEASEGIPAGETVEVEDWEP